MARTNNTDKQRFRFQVEIALEASNEDDAFKRLNRLLEHAEVQDYRILLEHRPASDSSDAERGQKADGQRQIAELIRQVTDSGSLVRLSVVKGRGVKLSLPCRILHYDEEREQLSVYHVDEKKVYAFPLNEIDDFEMG